MTLGHSLFQGISEVGQDTRTGGLAHADVIRFQNRLQIRNTSCELSQLRVDVVDLGNGQAKLIGMQAQRTYTDWISVNDISGEFLPKVFYRPPEKLLGGGVKASEVCRTNPCH